MRRNSSDNSGSDSFQRRMSHSLGTGPNPPKSTSQKHSRCECCSTKNQHDYLRQKREIREKRLTSLRQRAKLAQQQPSTPQYKLELLGGKNAKNQEIKNCQSEQMSVEAFQNYLVQEKQNIPPTVANFDSTLTPQSLKRQPTKELSSIPEVDQSQSMSVSNIASFTNQHSISIRITTKQGTYFRTWNGQQQSRRVFLDFLTLLA